VFARCLSAIKEERTRASKVIAGPSKEPFKGDRQQFIDDLEQALYASKIISYTQGFMLMRQTAKDLGWNLNYAGIAQMWRGGCIIKSVFLGDITSAYTKNKELESLLFDDFFNKGMYPSEDNNCYLLADNLLSRAQGSTWLAPYHRAGRPLGHSNPGLQHCARLL
jgi:6-phosphogluconate dehydrogenase